MDVSRVADFYTRQMKRRRLSLFEKVILANSLMLIGLALAGLWVTSHNLEAHHYLIDTTFIVFAILLSLLINVLLMRASFRPLFSLLRTIREVSAGDMYTRANETPCDSEISELARAFNSMLDQLEAARRAQTMLILQAQDEERRRLSLELHDESSQNLTALLVHIEFLNQSLQSLSEIAISKEVRDQLLRELNQLTQLTHKTLENIRTLALQLRPAILDDLGLQAAFRWLAEDSRQRLQLPVDLHLESTEDASGEYHHDALYETTLFRIAQECLTNVARHAHAQRASVSLRRNHQHMLLQVRDDGCGYDSAQHNSGIGILGIRERAALLGGKVTIDSQPGLGTTVEVSLPLPPVPAKDGAHE